MGALALDFYGDLIVSTIADQRATREARGRGFRAAIDGWVYGDMFAHDLPPVGDFHSPLPRPPSYQCSKLSDNPTGVSRLNFVLRPQGQSTPAAGPVVLPGCRRPQPGVFCRRRFDLFAITRLALQS